MRKHSFLLLILICIVALSGCSLKKRIQKADERFEIGEYYEAGNMYRRVYRSVPNTNKELKGEIAFKQGESYRLINSPRAEIAYQNAVRYNYTDSLLYFRYAEVLMRNGKYGDAAKNYEQFLLFSPDNIEAQNGFLSAQQAAQWKANPTRYKVTKFKEFEARRASNFSPAFTSSSADALVFSSMRPDRNKKKGKKPNAVTGMQLSKLYSSRKNASGKWEGPQLLEGEINSVYDDDGVACFTTDGRTMYFTRAVQNSKSDAPTIIMVSQRAGGAWSEPQKLTIFADSTISVAHPAIAPDGETFYFVADAPNGVGGKDIWKGKIEGTECKYIENLGQQINTAQDEMFPAVAADGTLYFSSNGLPGLGGLDLFKATPPKNEGEEWIVENMGVPFNSQNDDFGITFEGRTQSGFFTSSRTDRAAFTIPLDAIWRFELPEMAFVVEGKVLDESGEPLQGATVRMVGNDGTNARVQTRKDGTYRIKLDKNVNYVMLGAARGHLNQKRDFTTQGLDDSKSFTVDFELGSIFKPIQLDNIFYEFGKWNLTPESETGLQALVKILTDNPNITIELSAHTDYIGNNAANVELSAKRAQSVVTYLIRAGIEADRLTAVGYGEEKPVVVDAALAKKYPFLKEGDTLTESFILGLKPDEQQTANQINRRTEFRVMSTTYKMY